MLAQFHSWRTAGSPSEVTESSMYLPISPTPALAKTLSIGPNVFTPCFCFISPTPRLLSVCSYLNNDAPTLCTMKAHFSLREKEWGEYRGQLTNIATCWSQSPASHLTAVATLHSSTIGAFDVSQTYPLDSTSRVKRWQTYPPLFLISSTNARTGVRFKSDNTTFALIEMESRRVWSAPDTLCRAKNADKFK